MEQPPIQPRVNEAMERVEGVIGRPVVCPCCGGTAWEPATKVVRLLFVTEQDPGPGGEEADMGGLGMLILLCGKCSFVRSHLITDADTPETSEREAGAR